MEIALASERDQGRWDAFVDPHAAATPYHLWAWGSAVERAYGHEAHRLLALENGRVVGVLPLAGMRWPLGTLGWVSLPFCDLGGPLGEGPEVCDRLRDEARVLARRSGARVELRELGSSGTDSSAEKVRMTLPLPGSSAALWAGFPSKLRSQMRRAEKNGLTFRWGEAGDLEDFYRVFASNMRDLGSPVHAKRWFAEVIQGFGERASTGLVYLGDQAVGGAIVLRTQRVAAIPWASTLREHNRLAPNMLLYWRLLERAADQGLELFDFGRSTPGEGTYRFKAQWGAKPEPLRWSSSSGDRWGEVRAGGSSARAWVSAAWSRLPLKLATAVGPVLRRYISL